MRLELVHAALELAELMIGLCSVALLGSGLTVFLDIFVSNIVPFAVENGVSLLTHAGYGVIQVLLQFFYYRTVDRRLPSSGGGLS